MYIMNMPKSYSVTHARLSDILDDVIAGKEVQLTRRGRRVAVVLSPRRYDALRGEHTKFGDAYRAFQDRHALQDVGLEPAFFDSIRDRAPGRRAGV